MAMEKVFDEKSSEEKILPDIWNKYTLVPLTFDKGTYWGITLYCLV
jgi:hypothetical protein